MNIVDMYLLTALFGYFLNVIVYLYAKSSTGMFKRFKHLLFFASVIPYLSAILVIMYEWIISVLALIVAVYEEYKTMFID